MAGGNVGSRGLARRRRPLLAVALLASLTIILVIARSLAAAQTLDPPTGSIVQVANTDGADLNLRAGPSTDAQIVSQVSAGALLTVTGAAQSDGTLRWLPVHDGTGSSGWVDAQFTALVSAPAPSPMIVAALPTPTDTPTIDAVSEPTPQPTPTSSPVDVDARVKFPETSGQDQELIVWVSRGGVPVPGAIVTVVDDEGEAPFDRPVEPTDNDGRTSHSFDIRHTKGTVTLTVKAVAPDGGEGVASTSYFRR